MTPFHSTSSSRRRRRLDASALLLAIALGTTGCVAEGVDAPVDAEQADWDDHDSMIAEAEADAISADELASFRAAVAEGERAALASPEHDDDRLQAELIESMTQELPAWTPTFARSSDRTELAELSAAAIFERLGYSPIPLQAVEGDKEVYDDGSLRLRFSRSVPGYFKFANRELLHQARDLVGAAPRLGAPSTGALDAVTDGNDPAAPTIERSAAFILTELGVPASELTAIRSRAVSLETGGPDGEVVNHGTAAHVVNVHRQVDGLPVLGSECTLAFDPNGRMHWARCRWPQFRLSATEAQLDQQPTRDIAARMAVQLDRSIAPGASASDVEIQAGYAYAERVTADGVEYVPVLRAIMSSEGSGSAEFLETVSGAAL